MEIVQEIERSGHFGESFCSDKKSEDYYTEHYDISFYFSTIAIFKKTNSTTEKSLLNKRKSKTNKTAEKLIKLFNEVPYTSENFRTFCTGGKGKGRSGKNLHYKGSVFHGHIPTFMI